jgi:DNA-binding beta-propeller fold protein YncE
MGLRLLTLVGIPPFEPTQFDHGDVHLRSGRIFAAHTGAGTVEVIDGVTPRHVATIPGCSEASGLLCAQDEGLVFAAARGAEKVLVIEAETLTTQRQLPTGPRPNGLAWSPQRKRLLVADVEVCDARLFDVGSGDQVGQVGLPGRPRWCVYDPRTDRFLLNIREPARVVAIAGERAAVVEEWAIPWAGPHGLDLDLDGRRAFVACDEGFVSVLDLSTGGESGRVSIVGGPDATWYNPERRALYVTIGVPGVVDVVDTAAMVRREQLVTEEGAHTAAFDRVRQRLAVFLPGTSRVAIYAET